MQVDCYDFRHYRAISFGDFARIGRISDLLKYDAIMYQVGNNRRFRDDAMAHLKFMNARRVWDAMPILNPNGTWQ